MSKVNVCSYLNVLNKQTSSDITIQFEQHAWHWENARIVCWWLISQILSDNFVNRNTGQLSLYGVTEMLFTLLNASSLITTGIHVFWAQFRSLSGLECMSTIAVVQLRLVCVQTCSLPMPKKFRQEQKTQLQSYGL